MSLILRNIVENNQIFERFINCHDNIYYNTNVDEEFQENEHF